MRRVTSESLNRVPRVPCASVLVRICCAAQLSHGKMTECISSIRRYLHVYVVDDTPVLLLDVNVYFVLYFLFDLFD